MTQIASNMKKGQNMNGDNNPPKDKRGVDGEEVVGCHEGFMFQLQEVGTLCQGLRKRTS